LQPSSQAQDAATVSLQLVGNDELDISNLLDSTQFYKTRR